MFYPDDPAELRAMVGEFIEEAEATDCGPKAAISPHAGYVYSGPIAGYVFRALRNLGNSIRRAALFGPHASECAGWRPAAGMRLKRRWERSRSISRPAPPSPAFLRLKSATARQEHSLKVPLPFLQCVFNFSIVPFAVGAASAEEISEVIEVLAVIPGTLVLVTQNIDHYHPYKQAQALDAGTSQAIERLAGDGCPQNPACGARPIQGLLSYARKHGLNARTVCLADSGDTAGSRDQVVGYGAYVFV